MWFQLFGPDFQAAIGGSASFIIYYIIIIRHMFDNFFCVQFVFVCVVSIDDSIHDEC